MLARCAQCGYENNPYYRFCGMCGAALPPPAPSPETQPVGVSGPRVDLSPAHHPADDRKRRVDYLLEEQEPERGHWRMVLALILLIVSIGLLVWRARREGYPGVALSTGQPATTNSPAPGNAAETPPTPAQHQTPAAAPRPAPETTNPEPQPSQSPESQPSNDPAADPAMTPAAKPQASDESQQDESQPAQPKQAVAPIQAPPQKPTPEVTKKPETPTLSPDDKLIADAERYLYGNGVPQNCERAQRDLETAARKLNPKAESLLGTMYASGHCVPRDLPTSYRWFARALRDDPNNTRIERDLELIWKQMTPGEKQVAMRSSQ